MQGKEAPAAESVKAMADDKENLPWRMPLPSATTGGTSGNAAASKRNLADVAAQYHSAYIEWYAAQEEVKIVRREVGDVLRCMIEHLEIASRGGDALELPRDCVQPFTSVESDVAYLQSFVRNALSLHTRTLKVAQVCGAEIVRIPPSLIEKLTTQRLYSNVAGDVSASQSSAQTFDERFATRVEDEEEATEGEDEA